MRPVFPVHLVLLGLLGGIATGCRGSSSADGSSETNALDAANASSTDLADGGTTTTSAVMALGTAVVAPTKLRGHTAAKAGELIAIPAHSFKTGSTPGDDGRDPTTEPAAVEANLDAFLIDALPYPNDPAQPARTGVARPQAQKLCTDRGERLCTELEWERACKGPEDDPYSTGNAWDPACDKEPASCASGFGVHGMGQLREWTASHVVPINEAQLALPAVRGAGTIGVDGGVISPAMHRCAHRTRTSESRTQSDLAFRCCKGAPNAAKIGPIEPRPGFRKTNLDPQRVSKIFAGIPELSRVGSNIRFFDPADVNNIVARSGKGRDTVTFTTEPVLWSPEAGAELVVITGRSKTAAFVVALYPLPDDTYRLASYFLLLNEVSPIALAYEPHRRQDLYWSACWGCAGEQGSIRVRDDHRVVIVQH